MRQQKKNFVSNIVETAELVYFQRKTRLRRYKGARREAIEWEDYRRIHYIAASWFHPFPRVFGPIVPTSVLSFATPWIVKKENCFLLGMYILRLIILAFFFFLF
jgi:hypothetical protein